MKFRYAVSTNFKEKCKENVAVNRRGKIHIVDDNVDITDEDNLVSFKIEDNCYVNDRFIGTTVAKKITVNILNPNNLINLENKEIQPYVGIDNENVPFGKFIIQELDNKEVKEKTEFVGYDYMVKFNILYQDRVTYPISASNLFVDICNQVGLVAGNTDFPNSDYMILGNPFTNNEDCRTVLSNIAQLAGGFARIGRDNKPYIVTLKKTPSNETIDANNYFDNFAKNNQWGEVNSLVLGLSSIEGENTSVEDASSIAQYGRTEVVIEDNFFLTDQVQREIAITPIWNSIKGIKYTPFETEYYGYPYLDAGDLITICDIDDNEYTTYVFNHTFTFNGTFNGKIATPALTKTQIAYRNIINANTKFRQVERKIDKINGIIEDIVEEVDEQGEKISEHTQTIDEITDRVSSVEETTETIQQEVNSIGLTKTEEGQELEIDASENPAKLQVWGKTTQNSYNGNQLVDFSNPTSLNRATYTFANNVLTISTDTSQSGGYNGLNYDIVDIVKANPNKVLKFVYKNVDLSNFNSTSNIVVQLAITISGTTTYKQMNWKETSTSMTFSTYTIPSDTSTITGFRLLIYTNNTNTSVASTTIIEEPMLQFGTEEKEYEPYTGGQPAPSPDYIQDINNVGSDINLLNNILTSQTINNGTITVNADKSITINGTFNSVTTLTLNSVNLMNGETYRLQGAYNQNLRLDMRIPGTTSLYNNWIDTNEDVANKPVWTMTEDKTLNVNMRIASGISFNNVIIYPKLKKGSQKTGYSQYLQGSVGIKISNKNFLNMSDVTVGKIISADGSMGSANAWSTLNEYFPLFGYNKVTMSRKTVANGQWVFAEYDENYNFITRVNQSLSNTRTFTYTIQNANAKYVRVGYRNDLPYDELQLELGDTATTYEEHKERVTVFPFEQNQRLHIWDYLTDGGIYTYKGTWTFTGDEEIALRNNGDGTNTIAFNLTPLMGKVKHISGQTLSSHFRYNQTSTNGKEGIGVSSSDIYIAINRNRLSSVNVAGFKDYLAQEYNNGTPVVVEYVLAEEKLVPYTEEQEKAINEFETFKGTNYIYCIDDYKPQKIRVEYYPNTGYNDNLSNKDALKRTEVKLDTEIKQTNEAISLRVDRTETDIIELQESSISKVDVEYALGTSTTTAPTTGWSTVAPEWEDGKYMWQRTVTTYADDTTQIPHKTISEPTCIAGAKGDTGNTGPAGQDGQDGDDGIGVSAVVEEYYLSTSNTTQTGGSWKTTQDTWVSGKYIWTRSKITWTDSTITYTEPILATGLNNANTVANNANTKVDNLDIGGRNYALGTSTPFVLTGNNTNNQSNILYDLSLTVAQINAVASGKLICSFDMTLSGNLSGTSGTPSISVGQGDSPWTRVVVTETQAGTYHKEIVLTGRTWTKNRTGMRCNYIDTGVTVTISNFKVEIGNKYTDWTQAPEDLTTNTQLATVIQEQTATFNVTIDQAKTDVQSSTTGAIMTLLNNGYLTAEQVNALVNGNAEDIVTIKEQLTQTITNSEMQIAIQTAINGGVSYLKNTLFTINDEGLWIATSQDEFNAQYNNQGMYLYSYDEMIAKFDVDGSTIQGNLTLEGELVTPNLRMMNVDVSGVPHVHIHWIGG